MLTCYHAVTFTQLEKGCHAFSHNTGNTVMQPTALAFGSRLVFYAVYSTTPKFGSQHAIRNLTLALHYHDLYASELSIMPSHHVIAQR